MFFLIESSSIFAGIALSGSVYDSGSYIVPSLNLSRMGKWVFLSSGFGRVRQSP